MPGNNANMSPRLQAAREELNVAYDAYEAALAHYNEVLQAETGIPFTGPAADPQTPRTFLREMDAAAALRAEEDKRVAARAAAYLAKPTGAAAYEEGGYRSIRRMRSRSRRVNKKKRKSRRVAK